MRRKLTSALSITLTIVCTAVFAQDEHKLLAGDGAGADIFGKAVSIWDTVAICGATRDDDNGSNSGSAYIFRSDGSSWVQEQKLTATDGSVDDHFGVDVDIYDTIAVIGANLDDPNGNSSGSAYVFHYDGNTWTEAQKLTPFDGAADDEFGFSVAVWGDFIAIGSYGDDVGFSQSGSVYIFEYDGNTWNEVDKLVAFDGNQDDFFGYSLDIADTMIIVGAYLDDDNGTNSGSAYLYSYNGNSWQMDDKVVASNGIVGDAFGFSVAVSGNVAAIGAYARNSNNVADGAVYVFNYDGNNWYQAQELNPSDAQDDDWFGFSVGVAGLTIVGGAFHDDDIDQESGAAYVFRYDGATWIEELKLKASDAGLGDQFGENVAINGLNIVVGAKNDDDNGTNAGAAYVYPLCTYTPVQPVCVVTVNPSTTDVEVIWAKPVTTFIDSFIIYKESGGNFIQVWAQDYPVTAMYTDNNVVTQNNSYMYKVSTRNLCGNLSVFSDTNQTIQLNASHGTGSEVNLSWNAYRAFAPQYYRVWRDSTGTGTFELIHATQSFEFNFTDVDAPAQQPLEYLIEAEGQFGCPFGLDSSISNAADPFDIGMDENQQQLTIKVYPNPTKGIFTVANATGEIQVYDLFGRLVLRLPTGQAGTNKVQVDISTFSKGLYLVKAGEATRKLILY